MNDITGTVLLVDDNPINLRVLANYLKESDFKVLVATSGEAALKQVKIVQPDLILLDVVMPKIDGFETCRRLKVDDDTKDIPVIFMTSLAANVEDKVKGFRMGAIDYITKPFHREEVLARVTTHLRVRNLTENLQTTNRKLVRTISDLNATQEQLIEAEKMAALGRLVTGVAHEINTPIGIGITASSLIESKTKKIFKGVDTSEITRSTFKNYLDDTLQCNQLVLNNLLRVADLVQDFKQISVDQTQRQLRTFQVKPCIENTINCLVGLIKQKKHSITVNGDDTISIQSYPGVLSQIITNLVMNSITHAYKDYEYGHLSFDLTQEEDRIIIEYSDDGRGIPPEDLDKIFDPFFTTGRKQKRTGLGLYIVYNQVTQKLKGTILCKSHPGAGTKFVLELPLT